MSEPRDDTGSPSVEIAHIQREGRDFLRENNRSDIKAIIVWAVVLFALAGPVRAWWGVVLGFCVLAVLPIRMVAARHFDNDDVTRGILWTIAGSWFIPFPIVAVVPDALALSMILLVGPLVLGAAYLDSRIVNRLIPAAMVLGVPLVIMGLSIDGANLDERVPRSVFVGGMVFYTLGQIYLVLLDLRESHAVRTRLLHRSMEANTELRATEIALRESRQRLVAAADDERGRIERDLHDGAQQRLVALSVQLRLAADLADEGQAATSEHLRELSEQTTEAVRELRSLAHGVYPARLHDLGLAASLRAATAPLPWQISIIDDGHAELANAERLAAYFICLEAIQNATKHGDDDTTIRVDLTDDDHGLVATITDDGPGFDIDAEHQSKGLTNMRDRATAIGGSLDIATTSGAGTTVTLWAPRSTELEVPERVEVGA